ncbi:MAG: tRNA threonylcarbamoyladenosine dehydratase, partial [Firmicutes bacterium]|nr:tRNA threonylcarbamoyladenosine dehydratase [Bacillota bacterium]
NRLHIPIISCMGTGNKLDASRFEISDISKTSVCPLAKVMRRELKSRGIYHLKVLYSKEAPKRANGGENPRIPASISFVPPVAGMLIAGEMIRDLIKSSLF